MTVVDAIARASLELPTPYVAPEGKLETLIANIFAGVFGIDQVGANDDFFDIGGDSLLAETLSMEILQQTGREFPMSSFLEAGSPRRIAAALLRTPEAGRDAASLAVLKSFDSLNARSSNDFATGAAAIEQQTRPPIFVVHGRGGYTLPQPQFLQALAEGQKLRMLELPGIRGGRSYDRIEDIAELYIEQLTSEFPQGPILLASFCAGALIALEMAARLAEKGRPVKHLVLIDPAVRKNGTIGFGPSPFHLDLLHRTKRLFQRLLPRPLRLRYYDLRWNEGAKRSTRGLSADAQAKFYAALRDYRPRPYSGSVTILASPRRLPRTRDGLHAAHILPNRTIYQVPGQHEEVMIDPRAAELMQAVFDAALAEKLSH